MGFLWAGMMLAWGYASVIAWKIWSEGSRHSNATTSDSEEYSDARWPSPARRFADRGTPPIGRQLLERGLIDEIDLHIAPILLGDGIRVFDNPGGQPIRLRHAQGSQPVAEVDVRYHPVAAVGAGGAPC